MRSFVNPGFFGVILLCFALPFCSIRCNGFKLYSFSGIQLVTGAEVAPEHPSNPFSSLMGNSTLGGGGSTSGMYDSTQVRPVSHVAIPLIIILCIAVITIVMTSFKKLPGFTIGLISAGVILVLIIIQNFMLQSEMMSRIAESGQGGNQFMGGFLGINISSDVGCWFMVITCLGAIVFNIICLSQKNKPPAPLRPNYPPQNYPPQYPPGYYQGQQNYPPNYPPQNYPPNYPPQNYPPNYPPPNNPPQNNP
ncbi:MAG TPA: hypothetical protein VL651_16645 [Bacteroidia bacterium]|nr:hypothetical protein [Bacteroidia bacterium]